MPIGKGAKRSRPLGLTSRNQDPYFNEFLIALKTSHPDRFHDRDAEDIRVSELAELLHRWLQRLEQKKGEQKQQQPAEATEPVRTFKITSQNLSKIIHEFCSGRQYFGENTASALLTFIGQYHTEYAEFLRDQFSKASAIEGQKKPAKPPFKGTGAVERSPRRPHEPKLGSDFGAAIIRR